MPRVRYLGTSRYALRTGPTFTGEGDEGDVDDDTAERLTARDDFELVGDDDAGSEQGEGDAPAPLADDAEEMIEAGDCPWCSDYEGDNVGMHASAAHPDEWADYKEAA